MNEFNNIKVCIDFHGCITDKSLMTGMSLSLDALKYYDSDQTPFVQWNIESEKTANKNILREFFKHPLRGFLIGEYFKGQYLADGVAEGLELLNETGVKPQIITAVPYEARGLMREWLKENRILELLDPVFPIVFRRNDAVVSMAFKVIYPQYLLMQPIRRLFTYDDDPTVLRAQVGYINNRRYQAFTMLSAEAFESECNWKLLPEPEKWINIEKINFGCNLEEMAYEVRELTRPSRSWLQPYR